MNLPIYGIHAQNLHSYEKSENDIKKGIEGKEPSDKYRLEEEDLLKMNLDEAICGISDEEESDNDNYEEVKKQLLSQEDIDEQVNMFQNRGKHLLSYNSQDNSIYPKEESKYRSSISSVLDKQEINDRINLKKNLRLVMSQQKEGSPEDDKIIKDFDRKYSGEEKSSPIYNSKKSGSSDESIQLEDFKILKFISKGNFGSVYLAYLPQQDKYYAIKSI